MQWSAQRDVTSATYGGGSCTAPASAGMLASSSLELDLELAAHVARRAPTPEAARSERELLLLVLLVGEIPADEAHAHAALHDGELVAQVRVPEGVTALGHRRVGDRAGRRVGRRRDDPEVVVVLVAA